MPEASRPGRPWALWVVLLAAAGTFALTMGTRQSMGLFLSPLNTATGLGLGSISLAFAIGQLCWGLTQPFAGALADKHGAGRVLLLGVLLVAAGTVITPFMGSTLGLTVAVAYSTVPWSPKSATWKSPSKSGMQSTNKRWTASVLLRPTWTPRCWALRRPDTPASSAWSMTA